MVMQSFAGIAALTVLALSSGAAHGQQGVSGIGAQRCAILNARATAASNQSDTTALTSWIEGFISGLNMNAENDFFYDLASVPADQQQAQILAYCRNHPSDPVMNAALHMAQNALPRKPVQ